MNSPSVISLENVGFTHAGARTPVFSGINLELEKGDRLLVTGTSGSGKSTLLGIMTGLVPRFWAGSLSGNVLLNYERAALVLQNPEAQLVTPTVREEIAFPLENRGLPARIIALRVEEVLSLTGLTVLADRKTRFLSGGEAQRLSLACAIAQGPDVLFLDEPTAFLDPANASLFLDRLNDASGASSWIVVEHHTEGLESFVNRAVELSSTGCRGIRVDDACLPFSALAVGLNPLDAEISPAKCRPMAIRFTGARHAYPGLGEIFGGLEGSADPGHVTVVMGASGSGKSTLLKKIAGLLPSAREEIWVGDEDVARLARRGHGLVSRLLVVPQNPEHFFLSESIAREWELSGAEPDSIAFAKKLFFLDLDPSLSPAQLSEGEKRRLTLALAFVDPRPVILLDEPSYGLDRDSFLSLVRSLLWLKKQGRTILLVTHSIDLARLTADRLYVLSGGSWTEARP